MDFKRIFTPKDMLVLVLTVVLNLVSNSLYAATSNTEFNTLSQSYQRVSNAFYSDLVKNLSQCRSRTTSLKRINLQLIKLAKQDKNVIGLCLIQSHLPLIKKNIDNKNTFPIFKFLLDNNNLYLADKLYRTAKEESDQSFISNLSYIYAQFYIKRKKWNKVLQYTDGIYNDLTVENANLARLFTGIALQKTKQHREAIKVYSKIPRSSKYYPAAKLNIATAYIRQDWWTDAHININDVLKNKEIKTDHEIINRLYLVLGYSLMRKEFHRDSREAFRNVEIDSIYFNKALLGIILTAANQEDYIGALNAINILKNKRPIDLSVDEAHLLQPYIYEKLNQNMTASASYTDAQTYYKKRINEIKIIRTQQIISAKNILNSNNELNIDDNVINLSSNYPIGFLSDAYSLEQLLEYKNILGNKALLSKLNLLKEKNDNKLKKITNSFFDNRISYLERYMNQSRYGLARLFDHSNKEK